MGQGFNQVGIKQRQDFITWSCFNNQYFNYAIELIDDAFASKQVKIPFCYLLGTGGWRKWSIILQTHTLSSVCLLWPGPTCVNYLIMIKWFLTGVRFLHDTITGV